MLPGPARTRLCADCVRLFSTPQSEVGISFGGHIYIRDRGKQDFSVLFFSIPLSDAALSKPPPSVWLDYCNSFLTGLLDLSLIRQPISWSHGTPSFKIQPGTFNSASVSHHFLRNEVQNTVDHSVFPEHNNICLHSPICGFPLYPLNLKRSYTRPPLEAHSAEKTGSWPPNPR